LPGLGRRKWPWLAALILCVLFGAPATAGAQSFIAIDEPDYLFKDASSADPYDNEVTIAVGGTVQFSYPGPGNQVHNVAFLGDEEDYPTCVQTEGVSIPLPIPPLPPVSLGPPWAGYCTFEKPGTYDFYCSAHNAMTGKVIVTAASNQDPTVTASRTPTGVVTTGTSLNFTAAASDPDGDTLTYSWDFGDGSTSTQQNPSHAFSNPGAYKVTVTVSDGKGGTASSSVTVSVVPAQCTPGVWRDDLNGNELGEWWNVLRRNDSLVVANGTVKLPTDPGDIYEASNTAGNIVLRQAPSGPFTITAKLNHQGQVQYQQGGIIVYGDDDNYVKFARTATNAAGGNLTEIFEFIQEQNGTARNAFQDRMNVPAGYPRDFYLRINWDGTQLTAQQSQDGENWTNVGRASTAFPESPQVGFYALSNGAAEPVEVLFDWFEVSGPNVPLFPGCVTPENHAPEITSATRNPAGDVETGVEVSFAATATDEDGDTLSYAWDFGDGGTSTQQNPTHTYTAPGNYTVTVTVSDGKGGTDSESLPITVHQANRAPTVTASRTPTGVIQPGTEVSFTANASDPDNDPLTYAWDFGDGGTSTQQNPTHTYANPGIYTAKVTVSDGRGGTATDEVSVNVAGPNQNPTVSASRTPTGNVRVGNPISFSANGNDPDGDELTYSWDFGDGNTSNQQNPTHTYLTASTFTATVTVSDGKGGTASASLTIVVQANRNPTINAATATPSEGMAPLEVSFSATATDADGHAVTYEWDLDGDGTFETTGQTASRTYTSSATAVLRVRDDFGGSATRNLPINVFGPIDPSKRFSVLVFSKTAGFRHGSIPNGIALVKRLGEENNFHVDTTENSALFTDEFLARYDAVIWMSTTGDVLNNDQQAAFERYIKAGGGYVGVHSATDTEYTWPWYGQLTGAYFRNHPPGTPQATVVVEDGTKLSTSHLPERWTRVDEWYNFQGITNPVVNGGGTDVSPRTQTPIHVLLTMDESTYVEQDGTDGVDDDHPIAWCKRFDGGRMFYTALGHTNASFDSDEGFQKHLLGGIIVAAGEEADEDCGVDPNEAPTVSVTASPNEGVNTTTPVQFTATASDPDGDTLTYAWDFGDGNTSDQQNPTHTFTQPGTYTVTVTVSDGRGGTATASIEISVTLTSVSTEGTVGGTVDLMLALSLQGSATFAPFTPGVEGTYDATSTAVVTSTAGDAQLTVADPDDVNTGKLVNGSYVLEQPLQARATNEDNPNTAFAPVTGTSNPLVLLTYNRATAGNQVTIGFRQSIGAGETLRAGSYSKTLTFTLSTTTP
jgi:PKD repeat protein